MRLPHQYIVEVHRHLGWEEMISAASEMGEEGFIAETLLSLCFRRVNGSMDFNHIRNVGLAAQQAFPALELSDTAVSQSALATVVEVVGNVTDMSTQALSDLFDKSLDAIRSVQRAYGAVIGSPVQPITRQRCPSLVPMYKRRPEADVDTWHRDPFVFLVNDRMRFYEFDSPPIEQAKLEAMHQIHSQFQLESPFSNAGAILQDGLRAVEQEGDPWTALALLGASCERMLDELLGCLMWEEGLRPEECSHHFNSFIVARVVGKEFKNRLGGEWDTQGAHPVSSWFRDVALVRNEMLHGGRFPDAAQASCARDATLGLRDFVKDRLVAAVDSYPRTAWMMLGENTFDPGLRELHLDALLADTSETDWKSTSARWMRMTQHGTRFGRWRNPVADAEDVAIVAVIHPDKTVRWVVNDESSERAFALDGPPVWISDAQRRAVDKLIGKVPISAAIEPAGPIPRSGAWLPAYRLLPGVPALVTGECLDES